MNNNAVATLSDIKTLSSLISASVTRLTGLEEHDIPNEKYETHQMMSNSALLNEIAEISMEMKSFASRFHRRTMLHAIDNDAVSTTLTENEDDACPCCKIA